MVVVYFLLMPVTDPMRSWACALHAVPRVGEDVTIDSVSYRVSAVDHQIDGALYKEMTEEQGRKAAESLAQGLPDESPLVNIPNADQTVYVEIVEIDEEQERAKSRERGALEAERLRKYGDDAFENASKPLTIY